jgi:hypothetical protein
MRSRLFTMLIALMASALIAAGCGGGGGGNTGTSAAPSGTPTTQDEAIARCKEEAAKLEGDARKTAEAACEAGRTGDTTAVKDAARQQCLDAAKNIPDPAAKKLSEDKCNEATK